MRQEFYLVDLMGKKSFGRIRRRWQGTIMDLHKMWKHRLDSCKSEDGSGVATNLIKVFFFKVGRYIYCLSAWLLASQGRPHCIWWIILALGEALSHTFCVEIDNNNHQRINSLKLTQRVQFKTEFTNTASLSSCMLEVSVGHKLFQLSYINGTWWSDY
jgi:hypothetical protein